MLSKGILEATPPEGFNYKGAIVSPASALSACGSDWRQKIRLRDMVVKGKSYLCARQTCNTRAQEVITNPGMQKRRIMTSGANCQKGQHKKGAQ